MGRNRAGGGFYDAEPKIPVEERINLDAIVEQPRQRGGISIAVVASVIFHAFLIFWFVTHYHPVTDTQIVTPISHYVELMRQNPREFAEAPGKKIDRAPITAPLSDANRKASTPHPTGDKPTTHPGEGNTMVYTPPTRSGDDRQRSPAQPAISQPAADPNGRTAATQPAPDQQPRSNDGTFVYRPQQANANGSVDWRNAIKEVGKVASLGGGQHGMDLGQAGGEKGYADNGPLSFETQWYDWGEYAESMVSKIRVNWYENMPELLRTGVKGVVTIRFTIHRDGHISDITILSTSGIPPYDFAAKKAIELSSPLKPLPLDFPNQTERVTCMFFYNMEPPKR